MEQLEVTIPAPSEKQRAFLSDHHRHVAYGGARGGGKSWAVRVKAVLLCLSHPGLKVLILRKTYRELQNNHILPLRALLPPQVAQYRQGDKMFAFANGSAIWFGYCGCDADLDQYQGAEYDVLFFDEATHFKEDWIRKINLTVRQPNGLPKRTYYTCNPGGVGHAYLKRLFIDRRYEPSEVPGNYSFTQALVTDNQVLMKENPGYLQELEALPPKLKKAWLQGCWDIFEGQFFEEFTDREEGYLSRRGSHVIEPFEVPAQWKKYRSFDWGYNKPFSCGWWAVDFDGVAYRILELYGCTGSPNEGVKWTPHRVFTEIARIEREHRWLAGQSITGIADPAIWDASTGESIADTAAKCGVYFSPGDNKRIPGWMQLHYRLAFDEEEKAMLYVFKNCRAFIRTLPELQYDECSPEDLDTDGEDHAADEARYFCMARPIRPRRTAAADGFDKTGAAMFLDVAREDVRVQARQRMEVLG